jgi:hypothetical protein
VGSYIRQLPTQGSLLGVLKGDSTSYWVGHVEILNIEPLKTAELAGVGLEGWAIEVTISVLVIC